MRVKFKNIMSGLLATIMVIGSPLTSLASNAGSSAGQGSTNAGASTSSGGNGTWNLNTKTGYRFTICDGAGNPVSKIAGQDGLVSLDVINSGVNLNVGEIWRACATQQQPGINSGGIDYLYMTEFLDYIGESGHNFRWTDNNYAVYGDEVREFILKGAAKATDAGGTGAGNIGIDISQAGGTYENKAKAHFSLYYDFFKEWCLNASTVKSEQEAIDLVKKISAQTSTFASAVKSQVTADLYGEDYGLAQWMLVNDWNTMIRNVKSSLCVDHSRIFNMIIQGETEQIKMDEMSYDAFPAILEAIKKAGEYSKEGMDQAEKFFDSLNLSFENSNILNMFTLTSYAAPSDTNSLKDNSNQKDESVVATDLSVLYKIINLTVGEDKNYVFQLEGSKKKFSDTEGKLPTEVFTEKGYLLLVEPTIQGCPQGWTNGKPGTSYKSEVYGTAHNWLVGFGNSESFKNSGAYSPSFGNHQKALTRTLPNGLVTVSDWTYMNDRAILLKPSHDGQWKIADATAHANEGYGCHIYTALDLGASIPIISLTTIDTGNPPPSENPSSKYIIINRFFRRKNKDNSFIYEKYDTNLYNIKEDGIKVYINDRAEKYSLVEYGTSEAELYKPSKLEEWQEVSKHNTGIERGNTSKTLDIKKDTIIKTINILYEYEPETKVIKVYKTGDKVDKITDPEVIEGDTYIVPEEPGYEYRENKKSENGPVKVEDWPDTEGDPGTEIEIKIDEDTNTIYILYVRDAGKQIVLYSNELTYTYDLRDLIENRVLFGIYDMAEKSPGREYSCDGHLRYCGEEDCDGHSYTCSNGMHILTKFTFGLSVANNYDYDSNTTFIKDYAATEKGNSSFSGQWFANTESNKVPSRSEQVKPNGDFVLYRQKDKDLVTLYPNKNESLKEELEGLGITESSYTPSGTRIEKETVEDKYFVNHFETNFEYTSHDTNLAWFWPRVKCGSDNKGTWSSSVVTTPEQANKYYSSNQENVKTYYFLGETNKGLEDIKDIRKDEFTSRYKYNRAYSKTSAELNFYPYAKMLYRAKDMNNNLKDVYITSENLSTMKVFNAIQTGVYKKNEINANLDSTQWSTHARSMSFLKNNNISDKKTVLPGGAIQNIDTGNKGDTQVGIRVYQACLPDEQVEAVQEGFKVSESEAREVVNALVEEIRKSISGYGLVQLGAVGLKTRLKDMIASGEELHENTKISFVKGNSGKTLSDDKYYLRQDGSGSNRANFDCLDSRIENQHIYTIYSNTDGDVWITKDGSELARISLSEGASDLSTKSEELKLLDVNTKLITNYVAAIDRNEGEKNRYDRYDKNKYNEAFDGISVLVTDISFDVGFELDSAKRTNVLDPLLSAPAESKSDLYNFRDESKLRSSVYVTTKTSSTADVRKAGYLGTLKGVSGIGNLETGLIDIYSLVHTKIFYIPNATVSDLN